MVISRGPLSPSPKARGPCTSCGINRIHGSRVRVSDYSGGTYAQKPLAGRNAGKQIRPAWGTHHNPSAGFSFQESPATKDGHPRDPALGSGTPGKESRDGER